MERQTRNQYVRQGNDTQRNLGYINPNNLTNYSYFQWITNASTPKLDNKNSGITIDTFNAFSPYHEYISDINTSGMGF